jgi:hypothetical protein
LVASKIRITGFLRWNPQLATIVEILLPVSAASSPQHHLFYRELFKKYRSIKKRIPPQRTIYVNTVIFHPHKNIGTEKKK